MARRKTKFTIKELYKLFDSYLVTVVDNSENTYQKEMFTNFLRWIELRNTRTAIHYINAHTGSVTCCNRAIADDGSSLKVTAYQNLVTCKQCLNRINNEHTRDFKVEQGVE